MDFPNFTGYILFDVPDWYMTLSSSIPHPKLSSFRSPFYACLYFESTDVSETIYKSDNPIEYNGKKYYYYLTPDKINEMCVKADNWTDDGWKFKDSSTSKQNYWLRYCGGSFSFNKTYFDYSEYQTLCYNNNKWEQTEERDFSKEEYQSLLEGGYIVCQYSIDVYAIVNTHVDIYHCTGSDVGYDFSGTYYTLGKNAYSNVGFIVNREYDNTEWYNGPDDGDFYGNLTIYADIWNKSKEDSVNGEKYEGKISITPKNSSSRYFPTELTYSVTYIDNKTGSGSGSGGSESVDWDFGHMTFEKFYVDIYYTGEDMYEPIESDDSYVLFTKPNSIIKFEGSLDSPLTTSNPPIYPDPVWDIYKNDVDYIIFNKRWLYDCIRYHIDRGQTIPDYYTMFLPFKRKFLEAGHTQEYWGTVFIISTKELGLQINNKTWWEDEESQTLTGVPNRFNFNGAGIYCTYRVNQFTPYK